MYVSCAGLLGSGLSSDSVPSDVEASKLQLHTPNSNSQLESQFRMYDVAFGVQGFRVWGFGFYVYGFGSST